MGGDESGQAPPLARPGWQRLHGPSPTVFRHADFVSPRDVGALVEICDQELANASRTIPRPCGHVDVPARDHSVLEGFTARVAHALGLAPDPHAALRFEQHHQGEGVAGHVDPDGDGQQPLVATALLCLRAPRSGGDTVFPFVDPPLNVRHEAGQLLVWLNHDRTLRPDLRAYHAAEVITGGSKVTMTWFIRQTSSAASDLINRITATADRMGAT